MMLKMDTIKDFNEILRKESSTSCAFVLYRTGNLKK